MTWILVSFFVLAVLVVWGFKMSRGRRKPLAIFPADYGLVAQTVHFKTQDGLTLEGWFIPHAASRQTVVLVHGFDMNKGNVLQRTHFLARDYNLFYIDCRGAGGSEGHSSMGTKEYLDVAAAVSYLEQYFPLQAQQIGLYGISMGAAAVAYYVAQGKTAKCIALESSYYSFKNVAKRWAWLHVRIPYFPLVGLVLFLKEKTQNIQVENFALQSTAAKITCPVLMIQGEHDRLAPITKARKTYKLLPGPKTLWMVKNAGHTSCAKEGGETYIKKLQEFFKTYLK